MLRIGRSDCPHCHRSSEIYISQPRSIWEEVVILLLLRPVRCRDCMHRFLRPLFVPTPIAPTTTTEGKAAPHSDTPEKVNRRSA